MSKKSTYSIGDAARTLGCLPKRLTDWFYIGKLDGARCPVFAGRRHFPASYLPEIAEALGVEYRDAG